MSGLEVVGSVASVLQLAGTVYSISKTLYEVGDALSNAPSDIKDLARDLETFAEELHLLSSLLDDKTHRYSDQLYRLTAKIIGDCASICVKIDRILRKLRSGSFLARVKWVFKEKEIMKLLARLRDLKLSLMGTLSLLSALKADHMMDAMGVPNPSLLDGPKDERLKKETEEEVEETRRKLASISEGQKSETSLSVDTSGTTLAASTSHASSENQRSFESPEEEMGLPDTSQTASPSIISLTNSAQSRSRDIPLQTEQPDASILFSAMAMPMTNTLVQLPQAMASVQSFYSAFSRHEHDDSEHTDTPYGNFKSSERSKVIVNKVLGLPESIARSPTTCVEQQVPSTKTPQLPAKDGIQSLSQSDALLADWRSDMVNSSMKRFNISKDAAESWASGLPAPDLFLVRERAEGNKKRPPQSAIIQTLPIPPAAKLAPKPLLPNRPLSHQGCNDPDSPTADIVKRPTLKIQAPDEELDCDPTVGDFWTSPNTDNLIPQQQSIESVKRMSMKSRSIFTPTDKSRSVVSQYWASSTSNAENWESSPVTSNEGSQFVEGDFFPRRGMSNDDVEWNFSNTSELDFSTPIIGSLKTPPKLTDQSHHTEEVQEAGLRRLKAEKGDEYYFRRDTAQTHTVPDHWRNGNLPSGQIKKIPSHLTEQMREEKAANKTGKKSKAQKTKATLITKSKSDEERNDEEYYYRRDTSRVESVPGHWISDGEYSDGSGYIVKRKVVKEPEDRSHSPDHKRHLAKGALAGAGAAALITNHRIQVGEEHRGRNVVGGAALGAIGAKVSTRVRSRYREDRGRSRSRSSRSSSPIRLKSALVLASEGIAAAAAVKYAQDRAGPTERMTRGRSRTRRASRRRDSSRKYRSQSSGSDAVMRTRVIERETRAPSTSSSPPPPSSIRAPLIHQEIIKHHRHIDHCKLPQFIVPSGPSPPGDGLANQRYHTGFEHPSAPNYCSSHLEGLGSGEPERPRSATDIHPKLTAVRRLIERHSIQVPRSFRAYEVDDEPLLFDMSEINQQGTETKENPAMIPRGSNSKGKQDEEPSATATVIQTDEKSLPLTTSSEASISQAQILKPQVTKKRSRSLRVACDQCRKRKLRCDKSEPCGNCTKRSEPLLCTYAAIEKRLRLSIESRRSGGIARTSSATWDPPLIPSQQETKPLGPEMRDLLKPPLEIPKQTQPETQEVIRGIFDECDDGESDAEAAAGLEAMRIDEERDFQTGGAFSFGQLHHQKSQDENSGSDYRHMDLGLVGGGYNAPMSYWDDFGGMNTSQSEDIGPSMETRVGEKASVSTHITTHATSRAFSSSANPYGDWIGISDLAERRRIQNHIAQRNYRKKLKRRLEDLERRAASSSASPLQIHAETQQQEHRPEEESEPTLSNLSVPENLPPLRLPDETYIPGSSHTQDNSPWCSSASSSSPSASGEDLSDEKRIKKMEGKQLLTAGLATIATVHAAHNIYQSIEKREARHKTAQEGEMTPEEARKLKAKAKLQDAASVDIAALGIRGTNGVRHERRKSREKKEQRYKKRLKRQKRLGNGGDQSPRNISTATGTSKLDARYPVGTMATNFSPVGEIGNISSPKVNYWQQRKEALAAKITSLSRMNDAASGDLWLRGFQELHACDPNKSENISAAWSEAHSNAMLPPDASMASVASITAARLEPFINEVQPHLGESLDKRSRTTTEMVDWFSEVLKIMQGTLNFKTGAFVWTCLCTLAREILKGRETDEMTGEIPRSNKTLANISEIATLVARYNVLESMYQQWLGMSLEPNYEKSLIVLCVHVLRYLDMALLSRQGLVRDIYEVELESLIEKIREADITCRGFSVTILTGDESELSGSKVEDVSTEDEDSDATELGEEDATYQLS